MGGAYDPDSLAFTVNGADLTLPDVDGEHHGPTWFDVRGRVLDREGRGVPGVKIRVQANWIWDGKPLEPDPDGRFESIHLFRVKDKDTATFFPIKAGCVFSPDSVSIDLAPKDRVIRGDLITLPDFIGTDYTPYSAQAYFPLLPSFSWTYERTIDGNAPAKHTVTISGWR